MLSSSKFTSRLDFHGMICIRIVQHFLVSTTPSHLEISSNVHGMNTCNSKSTKTSETASLWSLLPCFYCFCQQETQAKALITSERSCFADLFALFGHNRYRVGSQVWSPRPLRTKFKFISLFNNRIATKRIKNGTRSLAIPLDLSRFFHEFNRLILQCP